MVSHVPSHLSLRANPGAGLGLGPGADEGLASCPVTDNPQKTTLSFKSAADHVKLEVVPSKHFIL